MKVVFLDIDGVLNYTKWYIDPRNVGNDETHDYDIDPMCVERIKKICDDTGAKIVISSDWKLAWAGTLIRFDRMGLKDYIIDKTPDIVISKVSAARFPDDCEGYSYSRGREIDVWLEEHPDCTNYVIIDDRWDFTEEQQPHFVHTDPMYGLTDDNTDIAIMILNHH